MTLALAGVHGYVYSEVEADEFNYADKKFGAPPPKSVVEEDTPEKKIAPEIDMIAELNTILLVLGCENSDHANAICAWLWDNPTLGVDQCRTDPSNAMETLTRIDDKESQGISRDDMLGLATDYIQEHMV